MARRVVNRRELRAEAEAAEARGLSLEPQRKERKAPAEDARPKPGAGGRVRVVWAVCDAGGRTVATFPFAEKPAAEARAGELKAKGKGLHFVRSVKEPIVTARDDD